MSDLELRNGESQFLLRARVGPEKGWLVKSFNWTGILEAKSDLRLLVIKDSVQLARVVLLALGSVVTSAVGLLFAWQVVNRYLLTTLSGWNYSFLAASLAAIFFTVLWPVGIIGLIYLLDHLTLSIQARHTLEMATLFVTKAQEGRFRHVVYVSVRKKLFSQEVEHQMKSPIPQELQLTVAATRQKFKSAIGPFLATSRLQDSA